MFIKINPNANYTIIPNEVIESGVSLQALGLYIKMRSKPKNWKFRVQSFMKECNIGKTLYYKLIKELYALGLIVRIQSRNETNTGFGSDVSYIFPSSEMANAEFDVDSLSEDQQREICDELGVFMKSKDEELLQNEHYNNNKLDTKKEAIQTKEKINKKEKLDSQKRSYMPRHALIDLKALANNCFNALQAKKQKEIDELDSLESEFKASLNDDEREAYKKYLDYRRNRAKGGRLKKTTIARINATFAKLRDDGNDMNHVVARSIEHNWIGLFPVKISQSLINSNKQALERQSEEFDYNEHFDRNVSNKKPHREYVDKYGLKWAIFK